MPAKGSYVPFIVSLVAICVPTYLTIYVVDTPKVRGVLRRSRLSLETGVSHQFGSMTSHFQRRRRADVKPDTLEKIGDEAIT